MDSVSESQTCAALLTEIKMATDHSTAQLCGVGNLNIFVSRVSLRGGWIPSQLASHKCKKGAKNLLSLKVAPGLSLY